MQKLCVALKVKIFILCFFTQTQKYVEARVRGFFKRNSTESPLFLWSYGTIKRFVQAENIQYHFNNQ